MVRNATTVAGVTVNWNRAYTPTLMRTSWMTATSAPTAMAHSKRTVMYSDTTTKNTIIALMAERVTSSPHDGPTEVYCTSSGDSWAASARALLTAAPVSTLWGPTCTRIFSPSDPE